MACCACCGSKGACCWPDDTCTQETCGDCVAGGGQWQGRDTACVDDACPCNPPADRTKCEKCQDGSVVGFCQDGKSCCDETCVPECANGDQGKCKCGANCCAEGEYCCNGVCKEGGCLGACCDGTFCTQETEEACAAAGGAWQGGGTSCDPNPCECPSGCPSVADCYLIVVLDYISIGGSGNVESINSSANDFKANTYNFSCQLEFDIDDIPYEHGGGVGGFLTIGYDAYCKPVISSSTIGHSGDCENDPNVTCVPVIVTLDCNPFP